MKLPIGVYVVSQSFENTQDTVHFTFQGISYEAQLGINAFSYLEELSKASLCAPEQPFCGYSDVPVVIMPAGLYKAGTLQESRSRTYLPCAMAILGENAGITPNGPDLRTPALRNEETVILGSFYFGRIALKNGVEGTLTLDGISLKSALIFDERSEGNFCGLTVKNCCFTGALIYTLINTATMNSGKRSTYLADCRVDGIGSYFGEGRLLNVGSGEIAIERLYFGNTDKFAGLTNYSRTVKSRLDSFLLKDSLFEHCNSVHGLSILLCSDCATKIQLQNCEFIDFAPAEDPALWINLNKNSRLDVIGCRFRGNHTAPAILIDGSMDSVTLTDTLQQGYQNLCSTPAPRRTAVVDAGKYTLEDPHHPQGNDLSPLDALYAGRNPYYCDFHCHSNSGGTSDGKTPIGEYVSGMKQLGVDCAAIVDHRQMRHFFLPEWNEQYMICGSEPSTWIKGRAGLLDYTMIFPDKTGLAQVMDAFPEFRFTGGWDGHYEYIGFTHDRFRELGEYVYSIGGLMSYAHPLQLPGSGKPEDYFFSEQIALETVHADINAFYTRQNHALWVDMLNMGMRVRTHGSSDSHGPVSNRGLTTVYAEKHSSMDIFGMVRSGDCAAGGVGIQMSIDDAPMGSVTRYAQEKKLYIRVDDFHRAHWLPNTVYSLNVYTDKGLAYVQEFDGTFPIAVVLPIEKRCYYRCEIHNESDHLPVAFSNPIWLD